MTQVSEVVEVPSDCTNLRLERKGPVGIVTIDRPPVNATSQDLFAELRDTLSYFDEVFDNARALVLRAEGRHFCAGHDLDEFATFTPQNAPGRNKRAREAFAAVYDCPVPVIGAVQGVAVGSGLVIASCCDVLICAESARFGTPEVGVGIMGGAKHLRRLVPEQVMRRMYFTTDLVPVAELLPYGSIYKVVPDEELLDSAYELADRITMHSSASLRHAKEALNVIEFMDLKGGYEAEQRYTTSLVAHPDSREARAAVLEKRPPEYSQT